MNTYEEYMRLANVVADLTLQELIEYQKVNTTQGKAVNKLTELSKKLHSAKLELNALAIEISKENI